MACIIKAEMYYLVFVEGLTECLARYCTDRKTQFLPKGLIIIQIRSKTELGKALNNNQQLQ